MTDAEKLDLFNRLRAAVRQLDCLDNSCRFATKRHGMRTNGGCRCLRAGTAGASMALRLLRAVGTAE